MANKLAITLHASAAETASGVGAAVDLGTRQFSTILLDVTAIAGTSPTLDVVIETSLTQQDWAVAKVVPTAGLAGAKQARVINALRYLRARWTLGGSGPSATFAVTGVAEDIYCTPADLSRFSIPAPAIASLNEDELADACIVATAEAAGYLSGGCTLPLTAWDDALRMHVANMAVFSAMKRKGFPIAADDLIRIGREDAISWLGKIANGKIKPDGLIDSTPDVEETGAYVVSAPVRGW